MTRTGAFPIAFAVTPRFDLFYALYTISNNAPSPLDPWKKRAMLRLPRDFDRVARRVAPLAIFWPLLADALQATIGEMTFDEIISTLREIPAEDLRANVLSGIFHDAGTVQALVTRKKSLRKALTGENLPAGELLTQFGLKPYDATSHAVGAMATLLSDPESFRNELALVIERFWQTGFRRDWLALEAILRAESFRMRDLQEEEQPLAELANELKLPVTLDEQKREVRSKSGSSIAYDRIDRCYIIPSAFNTRRWWAKYTTRAGRVNLYFPIMRGTAAANDIVEDDWETDHSPRGSAINAESVFRALGDTTRYAIASILARTPTTSAELARSLKVSKPTITHHVQALRAAGLIAETPSGGSTMLSLSRETVGALSGAAVEQLFSSTGDLPLLTTRKRRND
jgi:DNA-binding transcriptional ArsR family regulator